MDELRLTRELFLSLVGRLGVYEKAGQRAIHKPMLTLMALAHVQCGKGPKLTFPEIEAALHGLIKEFGTTANTNAGTAHYPFWYLQNDGYWEVEKAELLPPRKSKGEPAIKTMRDFGVRAGFTQDAFELLEADPTLITDLVNILLEYFPPTLRLDVLLAVGLDGDFVLPTSKRDAKFREDVLRAYSYSCAICGFDGKLWRNPVGIEAAHIRWIRYGGPNKVVNGICLCSLHHKIFDFGGISVDPSSLQILVSKAFNGNGGPVRALHGLHSTKLRLPHLAEETPSAAHLAWHNKQVFRSE